MKSFGHQRPVRDDNGAIIGSKHSPAKARTLDALGARFGADRKARLVVSLEAQDLIVVRPERTHRAVSIKAQDLYCYLLRSAANVATLAKARAAKERRAIRLAAQRQRRAELRLVRN